MREIKFRYIYKHKNTGEIKTEIFDLDEIEQFDDNFIKNYFGKDYNIFLIEQYTGMKDKNEKEIYEGDIVRARGRDFNFEIIGKIYFKEGYFGIKYIVEETIPLFGLYQIEIIGNIHENPELLEEKA